MTPNDRHWHGTAFFKAIAIRGDFVVIAFQSGRVVIAHHDGSRFMVGRGIAHLEAAGGSPGGEPMGLAKAGRLIADLAQ